MLSDGVKDRLIEHLPELTVLDMLGSSEGSMGRSVERRGSVPAPPGLFQILVCALYDRTAVR